MLCSGAFRASVRVLMITPRLNYRVVIPIAILAALGVRLIWVEKLPAYLRPGLHLNAYIANTGDGTISAIDLVKLAPIATIAVGAELIVSAKRLVAARQRCRVKSSIEEINVPPLPIAIHQT